MNALGPQRKPMIRINAAWLIGVEESIDALDNLKPSETVIEALPILFGAQSALEQLFDQSLYRDHLRAHGQPERRFTHTSRNT